MRYSVFFKRIVLAVSMLAIFLGVLNPSWSQDKGSIVIFRANWSASCREVEPLAKEVAAQHGLNVIEIDVDSQFAPKQAKGLGISIPSGEPPQVFYVNRGHATLLFSGNSYRPGSKAAIKKMIQQNLQGAL